MLTISRTSSIFRSISYTFSVKHFSKNARRVSFSSSRKITCLEVATLVRDIIFTSPRSGLSSPVTNANMVLFPAPFCPIRVSLAPRRTEKLASLRMGCFAPCSYETLLNVINPSFKDIVYASLHYRLTPINTTTFLNKRIILLYKQSSEANVIKTIFPFQCFVYRRELCIAYFLTNGCLIFLNLFFVIRSTATHYKILMHFLEISNRKLFNYCRPLCRFS